MICVNFKQLDNDDGFTLDQLFPGKTPGLTAFASNARADWVQLFNADDNGGLYGSKYFLYCTAKTNNVERDFTWRKSATVASDLLIKSGTAFWFYHYGDEVVTVAPAGQVEYSNVTPTITIHHGYNMISAPYAAGLRMTLKNQAWWKASGATAFPSNARADWIQAFEASDAGGAYGSKYFLYKTAAENDPSKDWTWRKSATALAPEELAPVGQGVWYYHYGDDSFTLELPYPYTLGN